MYKNLDDMTLEEIEAYFVTLPINQLDNYIVKFWNMLDRHYPVVINVKEVMHDC